VENLLDQILDQILDLAQKSISSPLSEFQITNNLF